MLLKASGQKQAMLFVSTRERGKALSCEDTDYLGIGHQLFKRQNTALPPPFVTRLPFKDGKWRDTPCQVQKNQYRPRELASLFSFRSASFFIQCEFGALALAPLRGLEVPAAEQATGVSRPPWKPAWFGTNHHPFCHIQPTPFAPFSVSCLNSAD